MTVGRNVHKKLRRVRSRGHVYRRVVDRGAQLHMFKLVGRRELLSLRGRIVQTLHGHVYHRGGVVSMGSSGEAEGGLAHRLAVLAHSEAACLGRGDSGNVGTAGKQRRKGKWSKSTHRSVHRT